MTTGTIDQLNFKEEKTHVWWFFKMYFYAKEALLKPKMILDYLLFTRR